MTNPQPPYAPRPPYDPPVNGQDNRPPMMTGTDMGTEPDEFETPAKRFHPAYIGLVIVRSIRGFIFPIALVIFAGRNDFWLWIGGAFAALTIVSTVLTWWFTTYQITDRFLRVKSGVLSRDERAIPLERIQAIDLQETPLARLLQVVKLKVETAAAGTSGSDITIEAVKREEAEALRGQLLAARSRIQATRSGDTATDVGTDQAAVSGTRTPTTTDLATSGELIRQISTRDLLIAGMTSGRIGPMIAIVGASFQFADDLIPERQWEQIARMAPGLSVQTVVGVALILALIAWIFTIAGTVLSFGGFTLRRDDEQLVIQTGLLDRRRSTIPIRRVQAITISEGWLRQPFGYAAVRIETAGYGQQATDSGILFPLIHRNDIPELLNRAVPGFAADLRMSEREGDRLPKRALRRYALGWVWPLLVFTAIATTVCYFAPVLEWWWGLLLLALLPVAVALGMWQYRDTFWTIDTADRLVVRGRMIARSTVIIPRLRIQRRQIEQHWLQRRVNLATFRVSIAGGALQESGRVEHLDIAQAHALAERLQLIGIPRRERRRRTPSNGSVREPAPAPTSPYAVLAGPAPTDATETCPRPTRNVAQRSEAPSWDTRSDGSR